MSTLREGDWLSGLLAVYLTVYLSVWRAGYVTSLSYCSHVLTLHINPLHQPVISSFIFTFIWTFPIYRSYRKSFSPLAFSCASWPSLSITSGPRCTWCCKEQTWTTTSESFFLRRKNMMQMETGRLCYVMTYILCIFVSHFLPHLCPVLCHYLESLVNPTFIDSICLCRCRYRYKYSTG